MYRNVRRVISWGIWRLHLWKPKVNKNETAVLIGNPLPGEIRREMSIAIMVIMIKCVNFKVYSAVCCEAWQ